MSINIIEDILSITDLKKNAHRILKQIHDTQRPVILTVNGKAEAVLVDAIQYEKIMNAFNMIKLLGPAEKDIKEGRVKNVKDFFKEFKREKKI
ncbi:MAG: type II toxin-antitoxin system Phd/YefM family antitoxin [bacterium]